MTTQDGFPPDNRFPIFLSEHDRDDVLAEQPDIGKTRDRAAISSLILKGGILVVTSAAIAIAILPIGNPVALLTDIAASWVDTSALQPGAEPSTSTIQPIAGTQDLPPTTKDASTRDETAAAPEPADQNRTEIAQPLTEGLLKQFQAWATEGDTWAAEGDTRAHVEPAQPAQDTPAQVVQQNAPAQIVQDTPEQTVHDAQAQLRPVKKHRRVRSVHHARAEMRRPRHIRAQAREEQNARVQAPPVADARAQEQPVQNTQAPWLQSFGWRN